MAANDGGAIYTVYLPFKCTDEQAQRLMQYAAARRMNKSEAIRRLITIGLDAEENAGASDAALVTEE